MTYNDYENGVKLTVNNATKDQLKRMVRDRDLKIKMLYKEVQEKQSIIDGLVSAISTVRG